MAGHRIVCPHCRTGLRVTTAPTAGARLKCPECRQPFTLPLDRVPQAPVVTGAVPAEEAAVVEGPRRKKSRKKRPDADNRGLTVGLIAGASVLGLVLLAGLAVLLWRSFAAPGYDPREVLEQGIAATGDDPVPTPAGTRSTGTGFVYEEGERIPVQHEAVIDWECRRGRWLLRYQYPDETVTHITVVNGNQGWIKDADETTPMTAAELADWQEELYVGEVESLTPIRKGGFTLRALGEVKVDGRRARGVAVNAQRRPEVKLYFDKESALLVKTERRRREEKGVVTEETFHSDYKALQGVKIAMKVVVKRNGKLDSEFTTTDFQYLDRLDEGVFQKP
jgi:predicted Zn finger-like uncharacterized protein